MFVYEGKVQAVIEEQCLITLETANIPFWTTIKNCMQFFESHHKVGIYFFAVPKSSTKNGVRLRALNTKIPSTNFQSD
ncbi:MAG: SPFH domain-containing protein [Proteobacteria bacterium]|nr:SPFH domain-containing protein [Pseudomonadota bacterium]